MAIQEAMLDSGATSNFIKSAEGLKLTGLSSKLMSTASGSTMKATNTALLPIDSLKPATREAFVIPELGMKALMSVKKLADNGYTTIFHPHQNGVTVHNDNDFELKVNKPAVLQGWRDEAGLWTVPFVDEQEINPGLNVEESALNVYELPTTKEVVRFLHGALGFLTQATLLASARKGSLITFPGMSPENITKHFPESDETPKGHMCQSCQGVQSTKVIDEDKELE